MNRKSLGLLVAIVVSAVGCTTTRPPVFEPKSPRKSSDLQAMIDKARDGSTVTIPFGEYRLANVW